MNKFKTGDVVIDISDPSRPTYMIRSVTGNHIQLVGTRGMYHYAAFRIKPTPISCLSPEEVAKALLQGKALEYYHDGDWHKVLNPKSISISFIQSGTFRYAVETMDYYGVEIPKPIDQYPSDGLLYGISLTKHQVYKCNVRNRLGQLHFSTPEQAQEALTAILKPFGIIPQPLDERLVQEQPR